MENLIPHDENSNPNNNKCLLKCSQCQKFLNLSDFIFYCKQCKDNFCSNCLEGHNEIFGDHQIDKLSEDIAQHLKEERNSILANPDLDLDDRYINRTNQFNNLHENLHDICEGPYSDLVLLFNDTITSIQEMFNEEVCKLKAKGNKVTSTEVDNNIDIDELKRLPTIERLKKIMDILSIKNKK